MILAEKDTRGIDYFGFFGRYKNHTELSSIKKTTEFIKQSKKKKNTPVVLF
jgi:hypothetical protein